MMTLWIVHRDSRMRSALARVAAAPESAISGAPGDPLFHSAPPADVVVLGLAGDLEAELEFAHRTASRLPDARWILVPERGDSAAVRSLFDAIDATILSYPPDARTLRAEIRATDRREVAERLPLSQRPVRDSLAERFARWFADLELPELMRALDPRLCDVPLLISGESGTGRGLIAQYVHVFGSRSAGQLAQLVCQPEMSPAQLEGALSEAVREAPSQSTIWLEGVDVLPIASQQRLLGWLELGPPSGMRRVRVARWIGTASDTPQSEPGGLHPGLRDRLGGISIRIPPLRERTGLIASLANQTALAWCSAHRELPRRFGEDALAVLEEYPWPGNLREFEAVVLQTLVACSADPIRADDLQYDGTAFAPLDAEALGVLIEANEAAPDAPPPPTPTSAPEGAANARRSEEPGQREAGSATEPSSDTSLQPLVAAIAHEMRNPLSTIRTFAELLPERYDDPEFRTRFSELVGADAQRIESVVARLVELASLDRAAPTAVDVSALLDELLDAHRELVRSRQLLVLKELDAQPPHAIGDAGQLRFALESLVARSLRLAPRGGDVYVASRHHGEGLRGGPAIRVLIRFGERGRSASRPRVVGTSPAENAMEFAMAEAIIRAQGGSFAIDAGEGGETVVILDIPA